MSADSFLAWEHTSNGPQRVLANCDDIAAIVDAKNGWRDVDGTADAFSDHMHLLWEFLLFQGQRDRKKRPTLPTMLKQRVYVWIMMTRPDYFSTHDAELGFSFQTKKGADVPRKRSYADIARKFRVSRSVIGRHVRDWNAIFKFYGSYQRKASVYGPTVDAAPLRSEVYAAAARRGHAARKRKRK
jgi:hypothetical protein